MNPTGYRLLTLDCYGTLIDWKKGVIQALRPLMRLHGIEVDGGTLFQYFAQAEQEVQSGRFTSYRNVLRRTLVVLGETLGFTPTQGEVEVFSASVQDWPPFPDSPEALRRLKARYQLAILSNVDDDLFAGSAARLGVDLDWVVTSEQLQSYKPQPAHFLEVLSRSGKRREEVLHLAQSQFHDIAPAGVLRIATLWINRTGVGQRPGGLLATDVCPWAEVTDMAAAADLLLDS